MSGVLTVLAHASTWQMLGGMGMHAMKGCGFGEPDGMHSGNLAGHMHWMTAGSVCQPVPSQGLEAACMAAMELPIPASTLEP